MEIEERIAHAKMTTKNIMIKIKDLFGGKIEYLYQWKIISTLLEKELNLSPDQVEECTNLFIKDYNKNYSE